MLHTATTASQWNKNAGQYKPTGYTTTSERSDVSLASMTVCLVTEDSGLCLTD